jgi:phage minor structural protein
MKPILFEKGTTDFTTNGIGRLSDAISCVATEARNGSFEVVLKYPIGGKYREEIVEGRILYTIHDDTKQPQPFDIYKVVASSKDTVTAYARHIAYRLQKYVVKPFGVIGATTAQQVFDAMQQDIVGTCPFTFYSDTQISPNVQALMTPNYPVCVWDMMGDDSEDHILYNFDGEYKYDGFTVSLLTSRGSDNGVKIRRGKNVSNIKATSDDSDMLSGVVPYWTGTDLDTGMTETVMDYDNPVVYASDSQTFSTQMIQPLDLTDAFETKPTVAEVKAMATVWLARHVYNTRDAVNYSVDLTDMTGLNDALKTVCLCDTVWLEDAVLGLQRKLKVIKTVYDAVAEKLTRLEIGSAKRSLSYALKYNNTTDVTSAIPTSSANGSTSTNTAKQASTNAVKIKALESAVADLNQGGGGGSGGDRKIGGPGGAYGYVRAYNNNDRMIMAYTQAGVFFSREDTVGSTTVMKQQLSITQDGIAVKNGAPVDIQGGSTVTATGTDVQFKNTNETSDSFRARLRWLLTRTINGVSTVIDAIKIATSGVVFGNRYTYDDSARTGSTYDYTHNNPVDVQVNGKLEVSNPLKWSNSNDQHVFKVTQPEISTKATSQADFGNSIDVYIGGSTTGGCTKMTTDISNGCIKAVQDIYGRKYVDLDHVDNIYLNDANGTGEKVRIQFLANTGKLLLTYEDSTTRTI